MRKVIFGGANSLDNYLARTDGAVDWLLWGDEAAAIMSESWRGFDCILMGRKTYDFAVRHGQGAGYPGVKTYVFSRTLDPIESQSEGGLSIVSEDAATFVSNLKRQSGKDICVMGGGELGRSLLEADLVDEVGFNIHPVLLGSGIPLFHTISRQIDLKLQQCRLLTNGCVYVHYAVVHPQGG
jgi:dihydrofolate reductase